MLESRRRISTVVAAAVVAALLGVPEQVQAQEKKAAEKVPDRVGCVRIVGNVVTPQWFILHFVDLRPGQVLNYPKLQAAERRLGRLGLYPTDDAPRVQIMPNDFDGTFKDIVIHVREEPWSWVVFTTYECVAGALTWDLCRQLIAVDLAWRHFAR